MAVRVLVIDDAPFIRDMIKKQLRDHIPDLEIKDAADGSRALSIIRQWSPEVILSDWEMPNLNGEELLQEVRSMPNNATLPFIMITSRGGRDHVVKAVQSGVSDYITKPFTSEELIRKVSKQLKAIGRLPSMNQQKVAANQNSDFSSVEVLMGGRTETSTKKTVTKQANLNSSSALLQQNPLLTKHQASVAVVKTQSKGKAHLKLAQNIHRDCAIHEISLQMMSCTMERTNNMPRLFDQIVVDIETVAGESLVSINGYLHAMQASENRPDTKAVRLVIRFVDNDQSKIGTLSNYIAQF